MASEVHNGPALEDSSRSYHVRYDTSGMILQCQLLDVTQARDIYMQHKFSFIFPHNYVLFLDISVYR